MISFFFAFISLLMVIPAFSMLALTVASLKAKSQKILSNKFDNRDTSLVVIVPAHNESTHLTPTLHSISSQLGPKDRLLVVADNCTDDTADVARAFGAETIERFNVAQRGKGFALA